MMEMVLQQQSAAPGVGVGMIIPAGVAACRPGPRPRPAAMAPMMAKQERRETMADDERQQQAGVEEEELRRGPWTVDEDLSLINYIAEHGEGRWNALARAAGLKRTGKSCRLRWLNYLRPDVKRGDFTTDEQLLILDLHSRWGNRWSKIAAHLPGRTDNEIKNYWRTRVQKHAKQLNCDVNSKRFKDAMRFLSMPSLAERAAAVAVAHHQPSSSSMITPNMAAVSNTSSSSCSPRSAVTTSSSGCSSIASESNATTTMYYDDGNHTQHATTAAVEPAAADHDDYWGGAVMVTTMHQQQHYQQNDHYDFWSTASALQHLTATGDNNHQFQQQVVANHDLNGWVQGFSDGILSGSSAADTLWSLDDI